MQRYVEVYGRNDPIAHLGLLLGPGDIVSAGCVTRTDNYLASAYFNEWARPQDWINIASLGVTRSKRTSNGLGFWRSGRSPEFSPRDVTLLKSLAPHLQRAAKVQALIETSREATLCLGEAIDGAGFAAFLIAAVRRILFANRAAEQMLRRADGLRSDGGRLTGSTAAVAHALETVVSRSLCWRADQTAASSATVTLRRGPTGEAVVAHIVPISRRGAANFLSDERLAVAVFVCGASPDFTARSAAFGERFGLTGAEGRVLQEIIGGDGLIRAAAKLGVSEATARTHAKRIFAKTNVSGQAGLIRLYFEPALPILN